MPVKWVNVYDVSRCYGGPEEGGWWFDAGTCEAAHPCYSDEDANVLVEALKRVYDGRRQEDRNGGIGRYSVLGGGDIVIVIEDDKGKNFPDEWPRYE